MEQAGSIEGIEIFGIKSIKQLFLHLKQEVVIKSCLQTPQKTKTINYTQPPFWDDIKGQEQAKRALIIAAAGYHNILLSGVPSAGKTMLAKTLVNLLPSLSKEEQIAATNTLYRK